MNDRPGIAIGHVQLQVKDVGQHIAFFEKLGIRTIVKKSKFSVQELRGGTHLLLRFKEQVPKTAIPFDVMVDDIDAAHLDYQNNGIVTTEIVRGRIHDEFAVITPDKRQLKVVSSHSGDRPV